MFFGAFFDEILLLRINIREGKEQDKGIFFFYVLSQEDKFHQKKQPKKS